MDLQQSFQMTNTLGGFDAHLLLTLLVMLFSGILGGLANFYLAERQGLRRMQPNSWRRYLVFGVVTALTAPLLLNMLSSHLLEGARTRPGELYVFAAFCLIYVVAARQLFESPAALFQQELTQLRRELEQLRQRLDAAPVHAAPEPVQEKQETSENVRERVTYNDIEILRALADENYVYGNLAALTEKTQLGRELISQRLTVLKSEGLIDTRINDKNVLHWMISTRGRNVLTDAREGQSEQQRKTL